MKDSDWLRLEQACERGDWDVVVKFLDDGTDFTTGRQGVSPLFNAVAAGQLSLLENISERFRQFRRVAQYGTTLLHCATQHRQLKSMQFLLEMGIDVNSKKIDGTTPLHLAAESNCLESVEILLKYGAEIETINGDGMKPYDIALENKHRELYTPLCPKQSMMEYLLSWF